MDMSFMSKFLVQGRDAGACLDYLSTACVNEQDGLISYTQWLNDWGTLEADLTVARHAKDRFMVVATDTMHRHVETHMKRYIESVDANAVVTDVSGALAQINIQGPKSRELMQAVTSIDMSNDAFPFRCMQEIDIGYARVTCIRITYLGELGYELYVPAEQANHVYDVLLQHGQPMGLMHCGLRALSSLRLEKAYRDYGHDIDNTDNILEAGLSFTCDFDKPSGFRGKDKVLAQKKLGIPKQRLVQVLCQDPNVMMYHGEVVLCDGKPVGDIRAASYGHTLGGAVGLSMVKRGNEQKVTRKWLEQGQWQVNVAGSLYPIKVSLSPMYDPKNERIKA